MGRIKSMLVKRTSRQLLAITPESFDVTFDKSKMALGRSLPSKKVRNKIAGYIARIKKRNAKKAIELTTNKDDRKNEQI